MNCPENIKKFHSEEVLTDIKEKLELLTPVDKRHLIKYIKKTIDNDKINIQGGTVVMNRNLTVSFN